MNVSENIPQVLDHVSTLDHNESCQALGANEFDFEDDDTCSLEELNQLFKHRYKIHEEPEVSFDSCYVLRLAKDDSFTCVAAGLSDGSVRLFEVNSERGIYIQTPIKTNKVTICGVRFVDETANLLLVGTTNGLVRLLDLRTKDEVMSFRNKPSNKYEPREILSFDRNSNGSLLAMGTVQYGNDVNLLFYDLRTSNLLFKYIDSHQDDLTTLRFHPQNPDVLCTGSTDGLVNIFNVKANDEYDAILTTVNTETTVCKVNWHTDNHKDIVSCITDTNCFKAYNFDGDIMMDFDRLKITETVKRKNESNCNLIDCHSTSDNGMMLLTGSNSNNGSVLRSCEVQNKQLLPLANFEGNSQIVRESIFDAKTNILITAGERGFVTLWTPLAWHSATPSSSCASKMKTKKSYKVTPY